MPIQTVFLDAGGLRLVVVSNASGTLQRAFERLGLTPTVDAIFDSYDEGIEKPDPRYFQRALDCLRVRSLTELAAELKGQA